MSCHPLKRLLLVGGFLPLFPFLDDVVLASFGETCLRQSAGIFPCLAGFEFIDLFFLL